MQSSSLQLHSRLQRFDSVLRDPHGGALISFSAELPATARPSPDRVQNCADVLEKLVALGLRKDALGIVEQAYYDFLVAPPGAPWDAVSPFRGSSRAIDWENCTRALVESGLQAVELSAYRNRVSDAFFGLLMRVSGQIWDEGIATALRRIPASPCCAAFMASAVCGGVSVSKEGELAAIALENVAA